ncbi:MAG: Cyanophycin synthetase [Firmicutes bacterium]|nr:Cyanophycin synthetase [candidate division NPL-UPA2 bacterium]
MHLYPSHGQARDVAGTIVDMIYPPGSHTEVPLVTVTGTNGKTTTTRLIAAGLRRVYAHVGYATSAGVYINERLLVSGDTTGPWSAGVLLCDPLVEAVALEVARGGIIRGGLGYNLADVAVVTNVTEDHLGQDGVRDIDELCHVKALVAEAVRLGGKVVVNAENAYSLRAGHRSGREMVLFAKEPNRLLDEHLAQGGRAAFVANGLFRVVHGGETLLTLAVDDVPITFRGKARHNVENCAAALAALYSVGVPLEGCREALRQFKPDLAHNPGRQKEDKDLRGRKPGEVATLLCSGASAHRNPADIAVVLDERQALRESLAAATEHDLVVVFYESLEATLDHLSSLALEFGAAPLH